MEANKVKRGGLSVAVMESETMREYLKNVRIAFGYVGSHARSVRMDRIVEATIRSMGVTDPEKIADLLTSAGGRYLADALSQFSAKSPETSIATETRACLRQWRSSFAEAGIVIEIDEREKVLASITNRARILIAEASRLADVAPIGTSLDSLRDLEQKLGAIVTTYFSM